MGISITNTLNMLNAPLHTLSKEKLKGTDVYLYDSTTFYICDEYIQVLPHIHVQKCLEEIYTVDYLNTVIEGKDVYASLHLFGGYLPTSYPSKYHVLEKGKIPTDKDWDYKKVAFDTEKTLGDLYLNACNYQYNPDADAYIKLQQAGATQNALKIYMQKKIMEIGGDAYDRIADLSRIVLFLLSKTTLTAEETAIITPVLTHAQSARELADIFNREKNIQDYVASVKADPKGYINE